MKQEGLKEGTFSLKYSHGVSSIPGIIFPLLKYKL
jgi:hypothetical protein